MCLDGVEKVSDFSRTNLEKKERTMNLVAYARLLHKKINSAHRKAKNPFLDDSIKNPFNRPMYMTYVWVEPEEEPDEFENEKG